MNFRACYEHPYPYKCDPLLTLPGARLLCQSLSFPAPSSSRPQRSDYGCSWLQRRERAFSMSPPHRLCPWRHAVSLYPTPTGARFATYPGQHEGRAHERRMNRRRRGPDKAAENEGRKAITDSPWMKVIQCESVDISIFLPASKRVQTLIRNIFIGTQ